MSDLDLENFLNFDSKFLDQVKSMQNWDDFATIGWDFTTFRLNFK